MQYPKHDLSSVFSFSWDICPICYRGRAWDLFYRLCCMSHQEMKDIVLCAVGGQFLAWEKKCRTLLSKPEVSERLSSCPRRIGEGLGRFSFLCGRDLVSIEYHILTLLLAQLSTALHLSTPLSLEKRSINPWDKQDDNPGWIKLLWVFLFCFVLQKPAISSCADKFSVSSWYVWSVLCFARCLGPGICSSLL